MFDCIIIGSGIAGMTAAIYLKRANKNVLLLEKSTPGGQINKTHLIENYPGFIGSGPELSEITFKQIKGLNINYKYGNVLEIINENDYKIIKTDIEEYQARTIIIATGRVPKKQGLKNEEELLNRGISYCANCDGHFYKGKDIAVQGGGNSALEESLLLSDLCKSVTIIHRNSEFKADQILIDKIKEKSNVYYKMNCTISRLIEKDNKLSQIELNNQELLDVEGLFIYIGSIPDAYFLDNINIEKDNNYIVVNNKMETNIKGIYACGDIIKKDVYQVSTAVGEGAIAAINVIKNISNK